MTEQTSATAENTAAPETAATEENYSLEDVYKEAGIEPQAQQQAAYVPPVQQPVVQPVQQNANNIPDPYDESHKAWLQAQANKIDALAATQQAILQKDSAREQQIAQAKLEDDIKTATDYVKENAGLNDLPYDDKTKSALANFELNERARTDPKFKALWDARDKTPQSKAAFQKALGIVSKEIAKKFEAKVDPKLAANRQALRAAQQSSATTETPEADENAMGKLTGQEFERAWAQMVRVNN